MRLRTLSEAECYARCYGGRGEDLSLVRAPRSEPEPEPAPPIADVDMTWSWDLDEDEREPETGEREAA